ncbi:MAG: DUF169 domain-containing protein [Acidimicrobiia bacterium]|nr:DUF169 domain-containing protein [Acidimicrobiia bacterium]
MTDQSVSIRSADDTVDWADALARLDRALRLRTTPIGMKMFETVEEMEAVPRIRRPKDIHTADQIVSMASRLNWTVGITGKDLVGAQCQAVLGLGGQDDEWYSGKHMAGVWFDTVENSSIHQHAMDVVPVGQYQAMAVSPLSTGRLDPPDICLVYATPGQMILLINGLQWAGYKKLDWGCVGESACADSWGRALSTGEPSLSIPCFAERRYGGVPDDELLMALRPGHLVQSLEGMEALSKNGLRYPIPPYGIQTDARAGLGASY